MKADAHAAGLDEGQLGHLTDHLVRRYVEPGKLAGCQTLVARHGHVGHFSSLGSMDLERDLPVAEDTIWRVYSMTKPVTGVALMRLYERGHFKLSDPVHRFLPEWRDLQVEETGPDGATRRVAPERPMTVRDLLMHMSGLGPRAREIRDEVERDAAADPPRGDGTLAELVRRLAEEPLVFHPGTRWFYSVSTDIVGRLVEVISGQRFDEFLQQEIFDPLGMVDTGFVVPDAELHRFAANYERGPDKRLRLIDDPETSRYRRPRPLLSGGGGLVSTAADYVRFCQMLLDGGTLDGVRVLGRKTVELMRLNHLPGGGELRSFALPGAYGETGFDGVGFGLTMAVGLGPVATEAIGSAGDFYWGGAASTIFWIDPAEELVVIFMTQLMPSRTYDFRGQLKALVYPALL